MSIFFSLFKTFYFMNQKFFASLTGKYLRTLALLFVLFGAAQQLSAQALMPPSAAIPQLKNQGLVVKDQLDQTKGTDTQIGLQYLRLEYYDLVLGGLDGTMTTQQALDKGALSLVDRFTKLPNTNVTLTSGHVQTVVSETTSLLLN